MDRLDATRGRSPVPGPPRGFAPIVHTPGVSPRSSHQGGRHPGFRPGLWSTGPTARPGTGERPVGAPDHSQGRNPWAAKPWAAKPWGRNPGRHGYSAPPTGRMHVPGQIRRRPQTPPAKFAGVRRHPTANAERLAGLPQTPRQMPRDLRDSRKRHGKCRETCGTPANATANAERLAGTPANATANAERLAGTPANILST